MHPFAGYYLVQNQIISSRWMHMNWWMLASRQVSLKLDGLWGRWWSVFGHLVACQCKYRGYMMIFSCTGLLGKHLTINDCSRMLKHLENGLMITSWHLILQNPKPWYFRERDILFKPPIHCYCKASLGICKPGLGSASILKTFLLWLTTKIVHLLQLCE